MKALIGVMIVATLLSCGPTQQQRDAERAALAALIDQHIAGWRQITACDAERAEWNRAADAHLAALRAGDRLRGESAQIDQDRAAAKQKMCEALQPSRKESRARELQLHDAWEDACLVCASGRECVDADRKRRDTQLPEETDRDKVFAIFQAMKSDAVCSRAGR